MKVKNVAKKATDLMSMYSLQVYFKKKLCSFLTTSFFDNVACSSNYYRWCGANKVNTTCKIFVFLNDTT